ncbi:bifunctional cobalt-precorrin-7 (C(5))-methyltransferase/cobalt-precorrin-6B (C(15))-methyltransferase, partial [Burkholderia sp. Ac-20353]|nr:bifunctional cobalt-precorrin-7 (C(5))-methyltransferase/cobalt-precorrin-6B (C(15))-methyltransferase [Burkholderia sp. Ac-20353]
ANAVTLQGEVALAAWRDAHGGTLTRVSLAHAEPLGRFDTWRQPLPVTLYDVYKPAQTRATAE